MKENTKTVLSFPLCMWKGMDPIKNSDTFFYESKLLYRTEKLDS